MKKVLYLILTVAFIIVCVKVNNKLNEYQLLGKVYQVTNEHWLLVKTSDGNIREFDGYGYKEGQAVTVVLNTMDTKSKKDDKIVKIF